MLIYNEEKMVLLQGVGAQRQWTLRVINPSNIVYKSLFSGPKISSALCRVTCNFARTEPSVY